MRWTKIAILLLAMALMVVLVVYVYPLVAPLSTHRGQDTGGVLVTMLLTQQRPIDHYLPYIAFGFAVVMYALISYDLKTRPRRTHGTAHYASGREAKKYHASRFTPTLPQPKRAVQPFIKRSQTFQLYLGKYKSRNVVLNVLYQVQHVLLTGPTGSGKSARFFILNLLRETGTRSLFIADLKNELYKICAGWLSQSMQVWLFAPTQTAISAGYNPLAHIHSVEDAQDFAETWVSNTGRNEKDSFWDTNSKLLISAMALHLVATEPAPPFSRLADMLTTRSYEEIRDTLRSSRSRDARYLAAQFLESMSKNERLIGSQMTETGNRFQLLASQNVRAVTATNDIDFEEMIDTPTAFFLSIPRSATRRYQPLMAVLMQQMLAAYERRGTNGVGVYLDEFTNIGYIPGFAEFIATARSLNVSLLLAIQNFSQLVEQYGKNDADTIKANAVTHLLLPGAGLEECRYYSERIGDTTVRTETINRRGSGLAEEITFTEGETRRRLMTPDEIRTMQPDEMLMLQATSAPLLLTTKPYYVIKEVAGRANWPYHVTRIRQESVPPSPSPSPSSAAPQGLPPAAPTQSGRQEPPIVVDADDQFFQQE